MKREHLLKPEIEMARLNETIAQLIMSPEMKKIGTGDVDDVRLKRSIDIVAETFGLKRKPDASEIFDRSFLPAKVKRMAN